jgi:hypothetical protein
MKLRIEDTYIHISLSIENTDKKHSNSSRVSQWETKNRKSGGDKKWRYAHFTACRFRDTDLQILARTWQQCWLVTQLIV